MALPKPGPIALRAVNEAEAQAAVGVKESGGNNKGKWIKVYLASVGIMSAAPWCMAFLSFRLVDAARDLGLIRPKWVPTTGYTPTFANAAKKQGFWISTAEAKKNPSLVERSDFAFFYGAVKEGAKINYRIKHVEVVTRVEKNGVHTIGANTSDGIGFNRDGDGVYRRFRNWGELGQADKSGFARLPF